MAPRSCGHDGHSEESRGVRLKSGVFWNLKMEGWGVQRQRSAADPHVSLGEFARGSGWVSERGCRDFFALHKPENRWGDRGPGCDPLDYMVEEKEAKSAWRRNYASINEFADNVIDVLRDQGHRGQGIRMSEQEARTRTLQLGRGGHLEQYGKINPTE